MAKTTLQVRVEPEIAYTPLRLMALSLIHI